MEQTYTQLLLASIPKTIELSQLVSMYSNIQPYVQPNKYIDISADTIRYMLTFPTHAEAEAFLKQNMGTMRIGSSPINIYPFFENVDEILKDEHRCLSFLIVNENLTVLDLYSLFSQFGSVLYASINPDQYTGYVIFLDQAYANRTKATFDGVIHGNPPIYLIKRKGENINLYMTGFPQEIDTPEKLNPFFSRFQGYKSCIVHGQSDGKRGYAFISFDSIINAINCMKECNGKEIGGMRVEIKLAKPRANAPKDDYSVYVSGIPTEANHLTLFDYFNQYGPVICVSLLRSTENPNNRFAFIEFYGRSGVENAINASKERQTGSFIVKRKIRRDQKIGQQPPFQPSE